MSVEFKDYTIQVKKALNSGVGTGLRLAAVEIASKAARLSRVRSGQLKGSWTYLVDEGARTATIGSPLQNAIWEEYGTGEYAAGGDGRKAAGCTGTLRGTGILPSASVRTTLCREPLKVRRARLSS